MAGVIKYDWSLIQKAHDEGSTWKELGAEFGVTVGGLHGASKRGDFSSRNASEAWRVALEKGRKVGRGAGGRVAGAGRTHNWAVIQKTHDEGATWRELGAEFGVSMSALAEASKNGNFTPRNGSEAVRLARRKGRFPTFHTAGTKAKMSISRIRYLTANPDKHPYRLYHSSKKSHPEQRFEDALVRTGVTGWQYAYQNGIYEYDFAFPKEKIDVEIDGGTHLKEHVKKIDRRRDEFSTGQGWRVLRFSASRVKRDLDGCISELREVLQAAAKES